MPLKYLHYTTLLENMFLICKMLSNGSKSKSCTYIFFVKCLELSFVNYHIKVTDTNFYLVVQRFHTEKSLIRGILQIFFFVFKSQTTLRARWEMFTFSMRNEKGWKDFFCSLSLKTVKKGGAKREETLKYSRRGVTLPAPLLHLWLCTMSLCLNRTCHK